MSSIAATEKLTASRSTMSAEAIGGECVDLPKENGASPPHEQLSRSESGQYDHLDASETNRCGCTTYYYYYYIVNRCINNIVRLLLVCDYPPHAAQLENSCTAGSRRYM